MVRNCQGRIACPRCRGSRWSLDDERALPQLVSRLDLVPGQARRPATKTALAPFLRARPLVLAARLARNRSLAMVLKSLMACSVPPITWSSKLPRLRNCHDTCTGADNRIQHQTNLHVLTMQSAQNIWGFRPVSQGGTNRDIGECLRLSALKGSSAHLTIDRVATPVARDIPAYLAIGHERMPLPVRVSRLDRCCPTHRILPAIDVVARTFLSTDYFPADLIELPHREQLLVKMFRR